MNLRRPLGPRGYATLTILLASMMTVLLAKAFLYSQAKWLLLVIALAYWFGSVMTLVLQLRNPSVAKLLLRAYVMPSACMGMLAGYIGILSKHHQITDLFFKPVNDLFFR